MLEILSKCYLQNLQNNTDVADHVIVLDFYFTGLRISHPLQFKRTVTISLSDYFAPSVSIEAPLLRKSGALALIVADDGRRCDAAGCGLCTRA